MDRHQIIIEKLTRELEHGSNNLALLVTGSVARGEHTKLSDLDMRLICRKGDEFGERTIDGVLVEIKADTVTGYLDKMHQQPMDIYQWLDAKVVFDKEEISQLLTKEAIKIYDNYKPTVEEISANRKWLSSTKSKIISAQSTDDDLAVGFNVSNVLWQVVRGIYLINNRPLPASTAAFRRIRELRRLPSDFEELWTDALTGDLATRTSDTLKLIEYLLRELNSK